MPITHGDWNQIQGKAKALIAQKGEPFSVGRVLRRDVARKLVWVSGFGSTPIPMMSFNGDINVYDEWREFQIINVRITANQTYIPHTTAKDIDVECLGGGGGGSGGANNPGYGGGGGGSGGWATKRISAPFPVAGYAVVIGAAGVGGTADAGAGANGGATTFIGGTGANAANISAGGGFGADGTGAGGDGATVVTGGDFNLQGRDGNTGQYTLDRDTNTYQSPGGGGVGGSSPYGGGGRGGFQASGRPAKGYGAGGGGGGRIAGNNKPGGIGTAGICIVKEYRQIPVVQKKFVTATPHVPERGEYVLVAHHFGSRELPKCLGALRSTGFQQYDPGLE
jgi:hypothetical protein